MKKLQRTVAAPADLALAMVAVPQGTDVELDIRLEAVTEGVLVTGTALVTVVGECSRCLEPLQFDVEVDVQELYEYPDTDARGRVVDDSDDDDGLPKIEGDYLDLEPTLRDAVVLALPLQPLCRPDCAGLCADCGVNLNEQSDHEHDVIDARWASLANLETKNDD